MSENIRAIKQEVKQNFIINETELENNEANNFIELKTEEINESNESFQYDRTTVKDEILIEDYKNGKHAAKNYILDHKTIKPLKYTIQNQEIQSNFTTFNTLDSTSNFKVDQISQELSQSASPHLAINNEQNPPMKYFIIVKQNDDQPDSFKILENQQYSIEQQLQPFQQNQLQDNNSNLHSQLGSDQVVYQLVCQEETSDNLKTLQSSNTVEEYKEVESPNDSPNASEVKQWSKEDMTLAIDALREKHMQLSEAATAFGIPSTTLWQRAHRLGIETPKKQTLKSWDKSKLYPALTALRAGLTSGNKAAKEYGIPSSTLYKIARREGIQLMAPFNAAPTAWTHVDLEKALEAIRSGTATVQKASADFGIPTGTLYGRCKSVGIELSRSNKAVWSEDMMTEALESVRQRKLSINQAAIKFGLPYSSLYGRIKRGKYEHSGEDLNLSPEVTNKYKLSKKSQQIQIQKQVPQQSIQQIESLQVVLQNQPQQIQEPVNFMLQKQELQHTKALPFAIQKQELIHQSEPQAFVLQKPQLLHQPDQLPFMFQKQELINQSEPPPLVLQNSQIHIYHQHHQQQQQQQQQLLQMQQQQQQIMPNQNLEMFIITPIESS